MTYGKGLNSIRWRFALASVVLTLVGGAIRAALHGEDLFVSGVSLTLVALAIGAATFFMASRLTAQIAALKRSTEAIAGGDFDAPVEVDCACEVGGLAQSFRKMTSRMNANVLRINTLAYTDPITALPNRSVVDHLLRYALSPERAAPFRGALMFIDLDGFKRVNDTLGHDGGDTLLREASGRILQTGLKRSLETIDTCLDAFGVPCNRLPEDLVFARFAGDEFVAILPGQTGRQALFELANRVLDCLRKPFHIKGQDVMIGASLGIAIAPDDTSDANELLSFADTAMYGAKQDGKGRVRFFDAQVRAQLLLHAETERDLRQALSEQGQLFLHYQPKLHCSDMRLYGVEALVRWQHPRRGLLMPADFIDLAERCGLMAPLGRRVLQLAVAQHTAWAAAGLKLRVAVNASPSQFSDPNFVAEVLSTLQSARMPPEQLTIEVTESLAMQDVGDTLDRLGQLRAAGVHIAIDDFGTGYSNLSQLARMPLDTLKIDRSLVQGIGQGDKRETIVRALIGMTHAMGYRTVAEGVETPQQLALLRSLGCDAVQGFLFARPMAAAALADWAAARCALPAREPELCT